METNMVPSFTVVLLLLWVVCSEGYSQQSPSVSSFPGPSDRKPLSPHQKPRRARVRYTPDPGRRGGRRRSSTDSSTPLRCWKNAAQCPPNVWQNVVPHFLNPTRCGCQPAVIMPFGCPSRNPSCSISTTDPTSSTNMEPCCPTCSCDCSACSDESSTTAICWDPTASSAIPKSAIETKSGDLTDNANTSLGSSNSINSTQFLTVNVKSVDSTSDPSNTTCVCSCLNTSNCRDPAIDTTALLLEILRAMENILDLYSRTGATIINIVNVTSPSGSSVDCIVD